MKKLILSLLIIIWFGLPGFSQKITKQSLLATYKQKMELAKKYNDVVGYKTALFDIISLEGTGSVYMDTLADYYFKSGELVSFILLTDDLIEKRPDDMNLLLKQAVAYENLGNRKEAVKLYEQIYSRQPDNMNVGFQLAWNQYQLKRIEEANQTLMSMKDKKFPEKVMVLMPGVKNKNEQVPLKAAYYNLLGLVSYDLHNLDAAIQYFDEALKIYPPFDMAKQNKAALELMKKKLESEPEKQETKPKK